MFDVALKEHAGEKEYEKFFSKGSAVQKLAEEGFRQGFRAGLISAEAPEASASEH